MKATLKPKTSYEVSIDGVPIEGTFERVGTWNGMVELRDRKSGNKIIATDVDFASSVLNMLNPEDARESSIIMASPDITAIVRKALTPQPASDNNSSGE